MALCPRSLAGHTPLRAKNVASGAHHKPHLYDQVAAIRADRDMADIWTSREACGVYAYSETRDMLVNVAWVHGHRRDICLSVAFERAAAAITNIQVHCGHLIDQEISGVEAQWPDSQARPYRRTARSA